MIGPLVVRQALQPSPGPPARRTCPPHRSHPRGPWVDVRGRRAPGPRPAMPATAGTANSRFAGFEVGPPLMDQPVRVDQGDPVTDGIVADARGAHRDAQQAGDADARRTGAHDDDAGTVRAFDPLPAARRARPPRTTAPVPWMSSLNDAMRPRYRSRMRSALCCLKSSNWTRQPGQTSSTPAMNASTSSSYAWPRSRGCR